MFRVTPSKGAAKLPEGLAIRRAANDEREPIASGSSNGRPGFDCEEKNQLPDVQAGAQFLRLIAYACYAERNPDTKDTFQVRPFRRRRRAAIMRARPFAKRTLGGSKSWSVVRKVQVEPR